MAFDSEYIFENETNVKAGRLKEHNYVCVDALRQSAHTSLKEEYKAASAATKSDKLILEQGLLIRQIGEYYCYVFEVSQLVIESYSFDKPHRFELFKKHIDGQVYSAAEGNVEIHLTESHGKILHELHIVFDVCILLDLVDRRLVDIDRNKKDLHSSLSQNLFQELNIESGEILSQLCDHSSHEHYTGLSSDQLKVVRKCLSNKFTLIWGPPGTGKSYTLLALIAELLASKKTILFSSNTNSAIDNVLEDIVKKNCPYKILTSHKDEAKIVRLGSQVPEDIMENFSPKGLALTKSDALRLVITELKQKQYNLGKIIVGWENVRRKGQKAKTIIENYYSLRKTLSEYRNISVIEKELHSLEKNLKLYRNFNEHLTQVVENNLDKIEQSKRQFEKCREDSNATHLLLIKVSKEVEEKENKKKAVSEKTSQIESSWFKKRLNKSDLERLKNELSRVKDDLMKLSSQKEAYTSLLAEYAQKEVEATKRINEVISLIASERIDIFSYYACVKDIFRKQDFFNDTSTTEVWDYFRSFSDDKVRDELYERIGWLVGEGFLSQKTARAREVYLAKEYSILETEKNSVLRITIQIKNQESAKVDAEEYFSQNRNKLEIADGQIDDLQVTLKDILQKIREEEKKLEEIEITIIEEADMLCLTMVKASYDQQIINKRFDVLIVDEFSMVSLPQLYCVASLVKDKIVLCGDHLQLPPICQSDEVEATKWMGQSFYEWHEGKIGSTESSVAGVKGKIVSYMANLETQHRMPSNISDLIKPWYFDQGLSLKDSWVSTEDEYLKKKSTHLLLGENITILDTSDTNCYSSRSISKSRYNLVHAAIISYLCKEFTENHQIDPSKIICISPYKHQANLIKSISHQICPAVSEEISERTWTIHKSQGRGGAIVIYDLTDGVENGLSGFHKTMAPNILNVAISRSKARLIIVCALDKMITSLNTLVGNPLRQVFERMASQSVPVYNVKSYYEKVFKRIDLSQILSSGTVKLTEDQRNSILVLSSHEYYKVLSDDIDNANKSILIVSPFITPRRMEKIEPLIIQALLRSSGQIRVEIITRPPERMFDRSNADPIRATPVRKILDRLTEAGVKVTLAYNTHEKLIIIDEKISYWGSLNSLSFRDTDEVNTRLEAKGLANNLLELAVQGRTEAYKISDSDIEEAEHREGLIKIAEKELNELAWILAGYYKRPRMAFLYKKTIEQLGNCPPQSWSEYRKISEISKKSSVLRNHLSQIEDIIHPIRGYRLEAEIRSQKKSPKQQTLFDMNVYVEKDHMTEDLINKTNNKFKTLDKIIKTGSKPDPSRFTFGDCKKILIQFFDEMTQKSMKKDVVAGEVIKYLKVNTRGKPYAKLLVLFNKTLVDCINTGKLVEKTTAAGVVRIRKP